MNGKKNKKITYGTSKLDPDEFDPKYVKIRITTFINLDVIEELKRKAKATGTKYQTLLNQILRDAVIEKKDPEDVLVTENVLRKVLREELKKANQ